MLGIDGKNYIFYSDVPSPLKVKGLLPEKVRDEDVIFSCYEFKNKISFCQRYNTSCSIDKNWFRAILMTFKSYVNTKTNVDVVNFYFKKKLENTSDEQILTHKAKEVFTEAIKKALYPPDCYFSSEDSDRNVTVAKSYFSFVFSPEATRSVGNDLVIIIQDVRRAANFSDLLYNYARGKCTKGRADVSNDDVKTLLETDVVKSFFEQRNNLISLLGGNILTRRQSKILEAIPVKIKQYITIDKMRCNPRVVFKSVS